MNVDDDDPWLDEEATAPAVLERNAAQEWERLSNKFTDAGYREGIGAGQQSTVQAGFDEGYNDKGVPLGRMTGLLRGTAASLLTYLSSHPGPSLSEDQRSTLTEQTRELVRKLGKFRVADLAGPDLEAEEHARDHGEDVPLPQEIQDQRDMDSLQSSLDAMTGEPNTPVQKDAASTPMAQLQTCKRELSGLLQQCGLDISLD